jgi:hypothetical protein
MNVNVRMVFFVCSHCGVLYGVPQFWEESNTRGDVFCPSCSKPFRGDKLTKSYHDIEQQIYKLNDRIYNQSLTIKRLRNKVRKLSAID